MKRQALLAIGMASTVLTLAGCSKEFVGGAAAGALGTGAAYEYQAKKEMDQLNKEYQNGQISKEEYERRKKEIESHSITQ